MLLRSPLLALALGTILAGPAAAEDLDFWSYNGQNLTPDLGSATMTATWSGFGLATETYATGTTLNALPGVEAGSSLEYLAVAVAFDHHKITISNLNLTGKTNVTLSYAVTSQHLFQIGENTAISYRLGAGAWSTPVVVANPTAIWQVQPFLFGSELDNQPNVSIRIEHNATFEAGTALRFDNVTVQAVPEPSTWLLLGISGATVAITVGRRRRNVSRG